MVGNDERGEGEVPAEETAEALGLPDVFVHPAGSGGGGGEAFGRAVDLEVGFHDEVRIEEGAEAEEEGALVWVDGKEQVEEAGGRKSEQRKNLRLSISDQSMSAMGTAWVWRVSTGSVWGDWRVSGLGMVAAVGLGRKTRILK